MIGKPWPGARKNAPLSPAGGIPRMVRRIVERFDPEKIILFGSHARGDAAMDSDVDFLIAMRVEGSKGEAQIRIRSVLHHFRTGYRRRRSPGWPLRCRIAGQSRLAGLANKALPNNQIPFRLDCRHEAQQLMQGWR